MKIGFIGMGIMGSRMAYNLQSNGHELVVHNRTKAKAEQMIAKGALWADTPKEVVKQADILFTMLSDPDAVYQVALGDQGFLEEAQSGTLWVDCSTVNPSFTKKMAEEASKREVRFIDAPVAGTKGPAEKGELLFFLGGNTKDIETAQSLFDIMGRKSIHVGDHGMGVSMKMVFNLLLGESMLAFSEAMTLGRSLGLTQDLLFNTLVGSPVVAPFIAGIKPKIESENYEANFPLRLMQKDLHLASITAYEQGIALPAVNIIKEIFALASQYGLANKDFSAIYPFINEKISQ